MRCLGDGDFSFTIDINRWLKQKNFGQDHSQISTSTIHSKEKVLTLHKNAKNNIEIAHQLGNLFNYVLRNAFESCFNVTGIEIRIIVLYSKARMAAALQQHYLTPMHPYMTIPTVLNSF